MNHHAIEISRLRKAYGEHEVLKGIDLTVSPGSVLALLGPNGAGKTTMVNILCTLLRPDDGSAHVLGHDVVANPEQVRALIGMTGQFSALDDLFTGRENLRLVADLAHLGRREAAARVEQMLDRFDLVEAADRPAATYSGGMKRRLDLAMTLVGRPRLIFLDEPTTGLDPRSRRTVWELVRDQVDEGVTVFLTTQYLEEADQLADQVAVLDGGRIVADGTTAQLKHRAPGGRLELRLDSERSLRRAMTAIGEAVHADEATLTVTVPFDGRPAELSGVLGLLDRAGAVVETLDTRPPTLDDVFFALTGHAASPADQTVAEEVA